jgi:hypothetical protein
MESKKKKMRVERLSNEDFQKNTKNGPILSHA